MGMLKSLSLAIFPGHPWTVARHASCWTYRGYTYCSF